MLDQFEMRTEDMPTNMQALPRTYPRETLHIIHILPLPKKVKV